jgi:hypothetical protein
MASTCTWAAKTVFGNKRVLIGTLTMTDGTDAVATGLKVIDGAVGCVQTSATNGIGLVWNTAASANGDIKAQSGVSGSVYSVVVFGR